MGVDYFLLPDFLKDVLHAGGYETMLAERDAWFKSPTCFIRCAQDHLAAMKKQKQLGLDILRMVDTEGDHKYDDYLPGPAAANNLYSHGQDRLGLTRRHIGSDQAKRAAGILGQTISAAGSSANACKQESGHTAQDTGIPMPSLADMPEAELSDTDNEEHQQKRRRLSHGRRRRRHLVSPTTARNRVSQSQQTQLDRSDDLIPAKKEETSLPRDVKGQDESRIGQANLDSRTYPNKLKLEPTEFPESKEKPRPLIHHGRFRVDSQHLAALMGVGATPPSSP
jgi:hypothetical protein